MCLLRSFFVRGGEHHKPYELRLLLRCGGRVVRVLSHSPGADDGAEYPAEVVKSRLLKLDSSHFEYVLDCMAKNTTKVRNINNYLLASLYNTPATIDIFYRAEVNRDMFGAH